MPLETPLAKRWRVALAEAEMTESAWAEAVGVTQSHVGQVVRGDRESDRLMQKITEFIAEQERALAHRLKVSAA
jgi:predicted transcriptional regulator